MCGIKLDHPFYYSDDSSLFIAGIDLISAAALTIRTRHKCVFSELNADVFSELPTVTSPASTAVTDDSVCADVSSTASDDLVVQRRELRVTTAPSTSFPDDDITLRSSNPPSRLGRSPFAWYVKRTGLFVFVWTIDELMPCPRKMLTRCPIFRTHSTICLLYTSDAADE